jgi:hypothetical protein
MEQADVAFAVGSHAAEGTVNIEKWEQRGNIRVGKLLWRRATHFSLYELMFVGLSSRNIVPSDTRQILQANYTD